MIIPKNLSASSQMSGFKNYLSNSFSVTISSQILAAGRFVSATAQTPLVNAGSISQVQLQYSGVSAKTYIVNGSLNTYWDSSNYEIESYYYFDSANLYVFTVVVNQTAGNYTIPAITINCRGFLFLAPF